MPFVPSDAEGKPVPTEQLIEPADEKEMKIYRYAKEIREGRFARIAQRRQKVQDTNLEDIEQLSLRVYRLGFPGEAFFGHLMYGGKLPLILAEIMAITAIKF